MQESNSLFFFNQRVPDQMISTAETFDETLVMCIV